MKATDSRGVFQKRVARLAGSPVLAITGHSRSKPRAERSAPNRLAPTDLLETLKLGTPSGLGAARACGQRAAGGPGGGTLPGATVAFIADLTESAEPLEAPGDADPLDPTCPRLPSSSSAGLPPTRTRFRAPPPRQAQPEPATVRCLPPIAELPAPARCPTALQLRWAATAVVKVLGALAVIALASFGATLLLLSVVR